MPYPPNFAAHRPGSPYAPCLSMDQEDLAALAVQVRADGHALNDLGADEDIGNEAEDAGCGPYRLADRIEDNLTGWSRDYAKMHDIREELAVVHSAIADLREVL